ncbi:MAG: transporter substrate-binding domain-containing protein [Pseudobdellovibrio sp.]
MKVRHIFLVIFLFLNNSFAGIKEAALKVLPESKIINITGHPDYAPIIWQSKASKELVGVAVELVEKAFGELNVKVLFSNSGTWGRAQEEVKEGRMDLLLPPYINDDRVLHYEYYKNPILMDETVVFVKKESKLKYVKNEDLQTKTGVAIIDDSFGSEFDKFMKEKLKVERLTKTENCFEFLMNDRADYMIAGLNSGLAMATKLGIENKVKILPKRIITTGLYIPFSKKSPWNKPEIHEFINQRIASYVKNGLDKKLVKKYWDLLKAEK